MFFLAATVKLQEDDNACLWIPTFLVPAFLSTIVAVCFVMVFVFDFVNVIVFTWMLSLTLNLSLSWSIKHICTKEKCSFCIDQVRPQLSDCTWWKSWVS